MKRFSSGPRLRWAVMLLAIVVALACGAFASNTAPNRVLSKGGTIVGSKRYYTEFRYRPLCAKATGAAASGTTGDTNVMLFPGECLEMPASSYEYHVKGTQTLVAPTLGANGLDFALDNTASDGIEICPGITSRCPQSFTVGTDKGFYIEVQAKVADVSGCNPFVIGFHKSEAYQADDDDYNDLAAIGIFQGDVKTETILGNAATVVTDTIEDATDAGVVTFRVNVSSTGVVTYLKSLSSGTALSTPTTTAAFTFADGTVLTPFIYHIQGTDVCDTLELQKWDCGLQ